MSVTVPTKDVGDIEDKSRKDLECHWKLEDGNERYIKLNLRLRE